MNKIQPVLEFEFQTIQLDQVAALIPTVYRSKYEAIRQQVITKIQQMGGDESFIFAPAKNSKGPVLDDNLIARICSGINVGLVREHLNWKIAFSDKVRAFVVTPYKRYKTKSPATHGINGAALSINGKRPKMPNSKISDMESTKRMAHLLELTTRLLGTSSKDLRVKLVGNKKPELSATKKAFVYVGRKELGIKFPRMGELLRLTSSAMSTLYKRASKDPAALAKIKILTDALTKNVGY